MNSTAPKVSIVIPTRDREEQLNRLIESIEQSTYNSWEIVIVNDSPHTISKPSGGKIKLLNNGTTKGLAYSRKAGAEASSGVFVLFIDDDNVIDNGMIGVLVNAMTYHPELLAIGPLTYYLSNRNKIWFAGSKLNLLTTIPSFKRSYSTSELINKNLLLTENLHNCFMIRRKEAEQVGWFDSFVFMNGTEFDLFQRIKRVHPGLYLAVCVDAHCYHDVPELHKNFLRSMGFENKKRVYYFQRNRGLHVARHGSFLDKISLALVFYPLFLIVYSFLFLYYRRGDFLRMHMRATIDGYKILFRAII